MKDDSVPFTDFISNINSETDNGKDVVIYNLIEYSTVYWKTSGSLWQYYKEDLNDNIVNSESFKFKINIKEKVLLLVIQRMLK